MDKKFTALMLVFFLVFGLFISLMLFNKQITNFARASAETDPSSQTSLIFAWPLTAKTGDKVEVNVFIRNANNTPLDKKSVRLTTNLGLINGSSESTSQSDKTGKALFILTSDKSGTAQITALVNDKIQLSQKISVKFE